MSFSIDQDSHDRFCHVCPVFIVLPRDTFAIDEKIPGLHTFSKRYKDTHPMSAYIHAATELQKREQDILYDIMSSFQEKGFSFNITKDKLIEYIQYDLASLREALRRQDISYYNRQLGWLWSMLTRHGVPEFAIKLRYNQMQKTISGHCTPNSSRLISDFINDALSSVKKDASELSHIVPDNPLADEAGEYMNRLLNSDKGGAMELIYSLVEKGEPVKSIYMNIFQPVQLDIGRLWQNDEISVAQEHYSTALTQQLMSILFPHLYTEEKTGKKMVATCLTGELHELGLRMVTDFFESEGWEAFYLGANMPYPGIIQTINRHRVNLLALSASMPIQVDRIIQFISNAREQSDHRICILVGGYLFNRDPDLWKRVGADGFARDASEAVTLGTELCDSTS
jgi:methanogenic corrinoid protein MtbC1